MSMTRVSAVALIAAAAWVLLIGDWLAGGASAGHQLCGMQRGSLVEVGAFVWNWSVMVAAMMLPELACDMRGWRVAPNAASMLLFLIGFFAVWELLGGVVLAANWVVQGTFAAAGVHSIDDGARSAVLLGLVAVAQFVPARFASRQRCEVATLGPMPGAVGVRAGCRVGIAGLRCCWGMMLVMMAAKLHDPLSVAAFALFCAYVRRGRFGLPAARLVSVALLADALIALSPRTAPL
jgi:predicted metal-binding membrane protein